MENNFYVGIIHHSKKLFKPEYTEKIVLYSENNINYLDLRFGNWYTTDENDKDYVERESLITTDVSLYREDYGYMLSKYKESGVVKKKKINN